MGTTGGFVATGIFQNTVSFNGTALTSQGDNDVWTTYYDVNNVMLSATRFGGPQGELPRSITVDERNCSTGAYSTGTFNSATVNINGATLINAGPTSTSDIFVVLQQVGVSTINCKRQDNTACAPYTHI